MIGQQMSDLPGSKTQAVLTRMWLEQMVGCDCDNGIRYIDATTDADGTGEYLCDRCVLVEVGGVRVRVRSEFAWREAGLADSLVTSIEIPAVEVADD